MHRGQPLARFGNPLQPTQGDAREIERVEIVRPFGQDDLEPPEPAGKGATVPPAKPGPVQQRTFGLQPVEQLAYCGDSVQSRGHIQLGDGPLVRPRRRIGPQPGRTP